MMKQSYKYDNTVCRSNTDVYTQCSLQACALCREEKSHLKVKAPTSQWILYSSLEEVPQGTDLG